MAPQLRIGLTGGIASGKSTVAQRFVELGVPVIDADEAARAVVTAGSAGLDEVLRRFGPTMRAANGELDRRALRELIFAQPERRRELEGILHPLIAAEMERRAAAAQGPYLVLAIPLLVEGAARERVDRILVVDVEEAVQIERLIARDGSTLTQAKAILAAQACRTERLRAADDVLRNAGSLAELRREVDQLHQRYLCRSEALAARTGRST
ncbi:MAG: dephospho-CoA kinase [Pseudomonadota bacterium]|nr:dephospho-CoA kinase [Pseudomonadota bacterium]